MIKKNENVSKAFDTIFKKSKRKLRMSWTDKGSEFISKHFKNFLDKIGIKFYHTENEEKSSIVERWNKTMKNIMFKMFSKKKTILFIGINLMNWLVIIIIQDILVLN